MLHVLLCDFLLSYGVEFEKQGEQQDAHEEGRGYKTGDRRWVVFPADPGAKYPEEYRIQAVLHEFQVVRRRFRVLQVEKKYSESRKDEDHAGRQVDLEDHR